MNRAALVLCLILSTACGPENELEQSPLTRQFIRVTKEVPAFGGVARENGTWVVSLLGSEQREAAETKLWDIFNEEATNIAVRVRPTRGSASEEMKLAATDVLSVEGVGTLDYDETTGYLRVGLTDVEAIGAAQAKLDTLDVPLEQVIFQAEAPIVSL
ncbi:hypothetical protein Q664_11225 [Archangium violaceum Cb vi76]|uniref:Lipoprotein n=1 Tax=Archangium violaceum Cb vi76 TaxID=1406225 RepID=A0A084SXC5_9BACT|nr:hypothetical protein Q664_11225 [Archangium violaceum Cb vi76]